MSLDMVLTVESRPSIIEWRDIVLIFSRLTKPNA